jgi:hypothetical protein
VACKEKIPDAAFADRACEGKNMSNKLFEEYFVKWEDIFDYWNSCAIYRFPKVKAPFLVEHIYVPYENKRRCIYGYDWILKSQYKDRIKYVTTKPEEFMYFGTVLNKGTLRTVEMLASSKDNEERAAIWIYTFIYEILPVHLRGKNRIIANAISREAYLFLQNRFSMWHHAMKKLTPDIYFSYGLFENAEFKSFEPIIDLAMVNAGITLNDYVPVLYNSRKDGSQPIDVYSIRRGDRDD